MSSVPRRITSTPFVQIPLWVLDEIGSDCATLRVYVTILRRNVTDRRAPRNLKWLIDESTLSRSTVYDALARLRDHAIVVETDDEWWLPTDPPPSDQAESSSDRADNLSETSDDPSDLTDDASLTRDPENPGDTSDASDVVRLANLLADLIEQNGSRRPTVTKSWTTEIDRMIRLDERSPEMIEKAIRWCQQDPFWRANIMSPLKLRKQFDRIRLQSIEQKRGAAPRSNGMLDLVRQERGA
jgi:hypothetical protein